MEDKELKTILADIQASPTECEWVEIKHNNHDPQSIGEYVSALSNGAAYMGQSRGYMASFNKMKKNQKIKNQKENRCKFNGHEIVNDIEYH